MLENMLEMSRMIVEQAIPRQNLAKQNLVKQLITRLETYNRIEIAITCFCH